MTETRGSYTPSSGDPTPNDPTQYDENGFDEWGYTAADKSAMMARFANRLADAPGTMAALLAEYRRMEGIDDERVRERLEISPEQFARLRLCLVPRENSFADDVRRLAEISGAKASKLANIVHQVSFLVTLPSRTVNTDVNTVTAEGETRSVRLSRMNMAARDRTEEAYSLREDGGEYAAAPAPASSTDTAAKPEEDSSATDTPPVEPSHDK